MKTFKQYLGERKIEKLARSARMGTDDFKGYDKLQGSLRKIYSRMDKGKKLSKSEKRLLRIHHGTEE